jgi:hypothetical protein
MNFRLPAILFATILVLGVVLLILTFSSEDKSTPTEVLMEELAKLKPEDITSVDIEKENGDKLTFTRSGKDSWTEDWDVSEPGGSKHPVKAPADPIAVNELISALMKAKPTASPLVTGNPAMHGLNPPSLHVTLHQGTERAATINFGDLTSGSNAVAFVTTSSRPNRPLATPRSGVDALFRSTGGLVKAGDDVKWANDFRLKTFFPSDVRGAGDDVDGLILTYKGKTLNIEKSGGVWKFVQPAGWGDVDPTGAATAAPGTFTGARPLLGAITSMQALAPADFVDNPSPEDLTKYGLNPGNPDIIKVEVKTKDKGATTVLIGKKDAAPASPATPGMPPSGKVWVKVEGEPGVIRANAGDLSGLASVIENPDPLRDRTLLAADKDRIDGIDMTTGGQTAKLRKTGAVPEWKLYGNPAAGDPQAVDMTVLNRLINVLTERRAIKSFPPPDPGAFTPGDVKAEVKIWASGFESSPDPKAEPAEKGKPTILVFGKKEGDSVWVRRTLPDGRSAEFLLPDKIKLGAGESVELIPAVAVTRLDLLDKNLKTFSPNVVGKITASGVKNYELVKQEKKEPSTNKDEWVFEQPADQKGKLADYNTVEDMIRILGTTHSVSRYVDEAPTPEKLAEYGLAPAPGAKQPTTTPAPRLKLVIALTGTDPTDKERVYEFGNITGDFVYARQAGKTAVFTLPKFVYDKFVDSDLRNREIFQFDPAKITVLEIEGWGGNGFLTKLKFEKKDGAWTAVPPSPAGFNVDPRKVDDFLNTLRTTSVKNFLTGGPAPEHGFGIDKDKMNIVLGTAQGYLLSLNIGAPTDGGASYFVWTSVLPQTAPIVTVDAARFKTYKESPGSFAK